MIRLNEKYSRVFVTNAENILIWLENEKILIEKEWKMLWNKIYSNICY